MRPGLAACDLRHRQRDRFGGGAVVSQGIVAAGLTLGSFTWTRNFTTLNLIAATTNALNGALLARRPDHYRNYSRRRASDGVAGRYRWGYP
jgi:hypothetical protein